MSLSKEFWEKIYLENASKLKGICRRYVSDLEIAEDLMHDAFLTAIKKQETYKGKGHFDAWLRRIAVNTTLMYLRTKDRLENSNNHILNEIADQKKEDSDMISKKEVIMHADFSTTELLEVIDKLPEHHKRVFNLYVLDNYTHIQIGKELNISPGTSKSHLARARKKIQQLLYQRAMENTQKQNKKERAGILLFIMPWRPSYIDRLFKRKFKDFQIEVLDKSGTILNSIKWDTTGFPVIKPYFWKMVSNTGIMATVSGIIITTLIVIYSGNFNNQDIPGKKQQIELKQSTDSGIVNSSQNTILNEEKLRPDIKKDSPVVVKRKIIQRKTLVVRDTIKIIDTSYVH